jgi:murein DD-endopeptidase MepM/ murein hydrolase activator NlpD
MTETKRRNRRLALIVAGMIAALILAVCSTLFRGYDIRIDDKSIGYTQNTKAFSSAINAQKETIAADRNLDNIIIANKITVKPVLRFEGWTSDDKIVSESLSKVTDYDTAGAVLYADNKPIGFYKSQNDAGDAVTKLVLASANVQTNDLVVDCGFDNDLKMKDETFNIKKLTPSTNLASSVVGVAQANQANEATSEKISEKLSETVSKIPVEQDSAVNKRDTAKTEQVLAASGSTDQPSTAEQTENAENDDASLNLTTVKSESVVEQVPYSLITQEDANAFKGSQNVAQQGEPGQAIRNEIKVYKGDKVVQSTTMSYTVTKAPVNEIVSVGTKAANTKTSKDGKILLPCNGYISSFARGSGAHGDGTAVDIANNHGTPIYASVSGTVTKSADENDGYGNCIIIKSDEDSSMTFLSAHMSSLIAKKGDHVDQGQVIGLMGSTGDSTGDHCHFEIQINNVRQNLTKYFDLSEGMNV